MVKLCSRCGEQRAALRRPKTFEQLCKECFYAALEDEVHQTIVENKLFKPGEKVAIAASGGKDSTVLAHIITTLNRRHNYGLDLLLLSIDEGISGYRDDSLDTVKRNEQQYQIPLHVFSYKDLYGWTMDEIVREIGTRSNCTFCGVFRRQALDRGATIVGASKMATGHNADDIAETVLLNIVRGDLPRLGRCANIITGEESALPRVKPFKYTYEKEIVMYAYFKKLDYFSTECVYAPFAARGFAREFVKDLEAARPRAIVDLIRSAEQLRVPTASASSGAAATAADGSVVKLPQPGKCERCGYISSQAICKACMLLDGLNRGLPRLGVSRTRLGKPLGAGVGAAAKGAAQGTVAGKQAAGSGSLTVVPPAAAGDAAAVARGEQQQPSSSTGAGQPAAEHGKGGSACSSGKLEAVAAGCGRSACACAAEAAAEQQAAAASVAGNSEPAATCSSEAAAPGGAAAGGDRRHAYLQNVAVIASHPSARATQDS